MAKPELGTKRVCPETGKKFYDLDKDPIVSPYTGKEYPLSFFEADTTITAPKPEDKEDKPSKETENAGGDEEEDDRVVDDDDGPEFVSLEDADEDDDSDDDDEEIPDIPDIPDVEIDEDDDSGDDDAFLEDDDEDDDLSDVIVGREGDDEET